MIYIMIRDINGEKKVNELNSFGAACDFCVDHTDSEDEILMVFIGEVCIYSQLMTDKQLTWEDLTGFFG